MARFAKKLDSQLVFLFDLEIQPYIGMLIMAGKETYSQQSDQ